MTDLLGKPQGSMVFDHAAWRIQAAIWKDFTPPGARTLWDISNVLQWTLSWDIPLVKHHRP